MIAMALGLLTLVLVCSLLYIGRQLERIARALEQRDAR
jgi:hypothetical protein